MCYWFNGDEKMKGYVVFLVQWMVWSGYTLSRWLSKNDHLFFKAFMFLVFLQIAIYFGKVILRSNAKTSFVTVLSLSSYGGVHLILREIIIRVN